MLGLDPGGRRSACFRGAGSRGQAALDDVSRGGGARGGGAARPADHRRRTAGAEYPDPGNIKLHLGDPLLVFAAADAGICKSGTTTLEAAIADLRW